MCPNKRLLSYIEYKLSSNRQVGDLRVLNKLSAQQQILSYLGPPPLPYINEEKDYISRLLYTSRLIWGSYFGSEVKKSIINRMCLLPGGDQRISKKGM